MPRKFTDALDHPISQPKDIQFPATGSAEGLLETKIDRTTEIESVPGSIDLDDYQKRLAFDKEMVEVMIHESTDQNPEYYVFLAVNGIGALPGNNPWVPRGVPVTIPRMHVERLIRAKPVLIRTVEAIDPDGAKTMRVKRSASLQYPFSVLRDPNPQGAQWLRDLMAEP